jgi:hypothetical protein
MLSDIFEINQGRLETVYDFSINSGGNIIIFGPAGIGKTEMAIQRCIDSGFEYQYINLSVLEAPDLVGLPKISDNRTTYATPEFLPLVKQGQNPKPIVLIVDELDKAKDEVESPMLELFQFRSINGKPVNVQSIIATGNLPEERAKSRIVSHALANRCAIYKTTCAFDPWRKWAINNSVNSLVVGFLDNNQHMLLKPNESKDPTAYCHPSPRAWTLAARELDAYQRLTGKTRVEDLESDPIVDFGFTIVAGRVGCKAAVDFKIWLKHYRVLAPVIYALVDDGTRPSYEGLTSDKAVIVAMGGLNAVTAACETNDDALIGKVITNVFGWLLDDMPSDLCLAAARSTLTSRLVSEYDLLAYPEITGMFDKIGDAIGQL